MSRYHDHKARRLAELVEIDGRMVHPRAPHGDGTANGYSNYFCRCAPCSADWATWTETRRQRRMKNGRTVDGRWIVDDAPHGTAGGYGNYGCRCIPCTAANTEEDRARRERKAQRELVSA